MELKQNRYYKLKVNLKGRKEIYQGKIISINKDEIRLETQEDFGCRALTFQLKEILYSKEIEEPNKKNKIFKISTKKKFKDLQESEKPEGFG